MKKQLIIIFSFLLTFNLYGQDSTYKNSIGFAALPLPGFYFASITYERFLNPKNSIGITCKFLLSTDDFLKDDKINDNQKYFSIVPAFKHYFNDKTTEYVFWFSIYSPIYYHKEDYYNISAAYPTNYHVSESENYFGIGAEFGIRSFLNKKARTFIDFGVGSGVYFNIKSEPILFPKVVLLIGRKL
jgi:hypothetical protein